MRLAYTPMKNMPPKHRYIATGVASISVSVVKLLVLPVSGTVSTSDLYNVDTLKHARAAEITLISFSVAVITTAGIRPPSWNSG